MKLHSNQAKVFRRFNSNQLSLDNEMKYLLRHILYPSLIGRRSSRDQSVLLTSAAEIYHKRVQITTKYC